MLLTIDNESLSEQFNQLCPNLRAAFAAACAERLMPMADIFALPNDIDAKILHCILSRLWLHIEGQRMSAAEIKGHIKDTLAWYPDAEAKIIILSNDGGASEHTVTCLSYALACCENGDAQQAIFAANRAYDAIMSFITYAIRRQRPRPRDEWLRYGMEHSATQAELLRQRRDLKELQEGTINVSQLHERARIESAIMFPSEHHWLSPPKR